MTTAAASSTLLQPDDLAVASKLVQHILDQMDQVLLGRAHLHRMLLIGILSRGHVLLEGLPGVGKTAMIKALGQILGLQFRRVQFTPDLMPSDILGTHILRETEGGMREMTFQSGPVFTNILLADEINRASPKTQSALLEAMQEQSVTLLGTTRPLPDPFFVLASQNPVELEGTYPLPEAQLDRFLFKLHVGDVSADVLEGIISTRRRGEPPVLRDPLSEEDRSRLFEVMERIYLPRAVSKYISRLVAASHPDNAEATDAVRTYVAFGGSPRAAIAMAEAARAHAFLDGRPSVGFEDVRAVAPPVLAHRLILNYKSRLDRISQTNVVQGLLQAIDETGMNLPDDIELRSSGKDARE